MEELIAALAALSPEEGPAALASLVWSSGSIPMSDRAKMLVKSNGEVVGTIGGGCLEAEIVGVATQVIASGQGQLTSYTMTEKQAGGKRPQLRWLGADLHRADRRGRRGRIVSANRGGAPVSPPLRPSDCFGGPRA